MQNLPAECDPTVLRTTLCKDRRSPYDSSMTLTDLGDRGTRTFNVDLALSAADTLSDGRLELLPLLEEQPSEDALQYGSARIGADPFGIAAHNAEVGFDFARKAAKIDKARTLRDAATENHAVRIDQRKDILSVGHQTGKNVRQVEIAMQHVLFMQQA